MQDPKYFPKNTPPAHEALVRLSLKIHAKCPVLGKKVVITGTSREDLNGKAGVLSHRLLLMLSDFGMLHIKWTKKQKNVGRTFAEIR